MSSLTANSPRTVARWAGPALVAAPLISLISEAVVAAAWNRRPYSYLDDYVNFLGNPFVGEFRGFVISSPLWWLMSIAWVVSGSLVAAASVAQSRRLTGWKRRTTAGLGVAQAVALLLFAAFPLGPARFDDGTLVLYLVGAFLSIIAGNALAIVSGLSGSALGLPRWLAIASIVLGCIGLLNIPLTYGWTPTGLAERISLYSYLLWALLTGLALTRASAAHPRRQA
ncbi:DUF998 domain-containing protein [Cryptosporangium sp. NPDC051539]|uniref:DUF998 domain-containing protein n=1 Tax=Cryptosporangium sp. NPDC051539 TaxID=3363962 RepID=UPI0037ABDFC2